MTLKELKLKGTTGSSPGSAKNCGIRFGIHELDYLLDKEHRRVMVGKVHQKHATQACLSLCIMGPDGTGKSILALHIASHYVLDADEHGRSQPIVLYFSTDLSESQAKTSWEAFALNDPELRYDRLPEFAKGVDVKPKPKCKQITLDGVSPFLNTAVSEPSLSAVLVNSMGGGAGVTNRVLFLDSQAKPCGDDWLYLSRLISSLPDPQDGWPHLLVIDAVEGLEPAFGRRDLFGHVSAGRTRLAQLIRAAKGKCHIVYVVEEPRPGETLDTQYVTDVVLRLRIQQFGNYSHRTVEVEKARGCTQVRGQHDFAIRSGGGSATGEEPNADDPVVCRVIPPPKKPNRDQLIAYMHVMRSLHSMSREVLELPSGETPDINPMRDRVYEFGIHYLDSLLPRIQIDKGKGNGLIGGTSSALIGPLTTHKSRLARSFLSQVLPHDLDKRVKIPRFLSSLPDCNSALVGGKLHSDIQQVGVLISTQRIDRLALLRAAWVHRYGLPLSKKLAETIINKGLCPFIVRRLEVHRYSSQGIIHVIKEAVQRAQRWLLEPDEYLLNVRTRHGTTASRNKCRNIRFVFDDWHVFQDTFPEAARDPMLLPHIVHYLSRQGITALFLDTEPGIPLSPDAHADVTLRALTSRHIYTWLVPFYGERRIAVTTMPPSAAGVPSPIYELRPKHDRSDGEFEDERLLVDPHFEMYSGLESNNVHRVALRVMLYDGGKSLGNVGTTESEHTSTMRHLMDDLFGDGDRSTLETVDSAGYDRMRDYAYLQGDTRLDHTLVMQVDEFWSESVPSLADLRDYMTTKIDDSDSDRIEIEDPSLLLRGNAIRCDVFTTAQRGNDYSRYDEAKIARLDKCPFLWDFGFLMAHREQWLALSKFKNNTSDIWDSLSVFTLDTGEAKPQEHNTKTVSWMSFFELCADARNQGFVPFDVDLQTTEVLACLVLEVWCSLLTSAGVTLPEQIKNGVRHSKPTHRTGIIELIEAQHDDKNYGMPTLAVALQLIFQNLPKLELNGGSFVCRPANPDAFAARHYYSTASRAVYNTGRLVPVRLPGSYSVRGDWFLAMAKGSRSPRLGQRAMDLLGSSRGNFERLRAGVGLPVRQTLPDKHEAVVRTALRAPWKSDLTPNLSHDHVTLGQIYKLAPGTGSVFLWRSLLRHYDLTSRQFQRWLARMYASRDLWRVNLDPSLSTVFGGNEMDVRRQLDQILPIGASSGSMLPFQREIELFQAMIKSVGHSKD